MLPEAHQPFPAAKPRMHLVLVLDSQASRWHSFSVLLFLEKPFPLCDLQGGSSAPASSHHWWEISALPPFHQPLHRPGQKHGFLQVLAQCLECSLPCILLISRSSFSLNP